MFGCLRRLGCLVVLAIVCVGAWVFRDRWMPMVFGNRGSATAQWEPVTAEGGRKATTVLESLGQKTGPVFANLTAAQAAGLLLAGSEQIFPASVQDAQAAVVGDQVHLRANVSLEDIKGLDVPGAFSDFVSKREKFELGGTIDILKPGVAQLRVESAQFGELPIPKAAIPKVLDRLAPKARPAGTAPNGVTFRVPSYIGDVRVSKGKITVYKNVS